MWNLNEDGQYVSPQRPSSKNNLKLVLTGSGQQGSDLSTLVSEILLSERVKGGVEQEYRHHKTHDRCPDHVYHVVEMILETSHSNPRGGG